MKQLFILILLTGFSSCARSQEPVFVGSTPAAPEVRQLLEIPFSDSVDFIRWKLVLSRDKYQLDCRYGISKPGTKGFINEKRIALDGAVSRTGNVYQLRHGSKYIKMASLNENVLHLLDSKNAMLIGNGGYSYALNNSKPVSSNMIHFPSRRETTRDSIAFQGRTPCQPLGSITGRGNHASCEKLKWYLVLYFDTKTSKPTYYLEGSRQERRDGKNRGTWDIIEKNNQTYYRLDPEKGNKATHLINAGDRILFFTDATGNLLVGNEDFSYTLNLVVERL